MNYVNKKRICCFTIISCLLLLFSLVILPLGMKNKKDNDYIKEFNVYPLEFRGMFKNTVLYPNLNSDDTLIIYTKNEINSSERFYISTDDIKKCYIEKSKYIMEITLNDKCFQEFKSDIQPEKIVKINNIDVKFYNPQNDKTYIGFIYNGIKYKIISKVITTNTDFCYNMLQNIAEDLLLEKQI